MSAFWLLVAGMAAAISLFLVELLASCAGVVAPPGPESNNEVKDATGCMPARHQCTCITCPIHSSGKDEGGS